MVPGNVLFSRVIVTIVHSTKHETLQHCLSCDFPWLCFVFVFQFMTCFSMGLPWLTEFGPSFTQFRSYKARYRIPMDEVDKILVPLSDCMLFLLYPSNLRRKSCFYSYQLKKKTPQNDQLCDVIRKRVVDWTLVMG